MSIVKESIGRVSQCITNSLSQLRQSDENPNYPISEADLDHWTHCPLCHSSDSQSISDVYLNKEFRFFSTSICKNCKHIYRDTTPNAKWFIERWTQISTGILSVYNPDLEVKRKIRYELYYGILQKYVAKGLLLDVGAAYGSGTNVFIERGFNAEALEPETDRANYIKHKYDIPVHQETIENFAPIKNKYDLILFAHCLEHITDPLDSLTKLKACLHEDGYLYIEIPIAWRIIDWQDSFFMAHKHNFIEKNFYDILIKSGFNIVDRYLIPDNDGPFCNLAVIATKSSRVKNINAALSLNPLFDPKSYTLNDLASMYRIQLPCAAPDTATLKYSVPYINHFYHILRNNRESFSFKDGYIQFMEKE